MTPGATVRAGRVPTRAARRHVPVAFALALALLAAGCGVGDPDAVVVDSERVTTTERPGTTEGSGGGGGTSTTDGATTTEGTTGPPETSGDTIPGDDFGCPASGGTSLFPCDDDDPSDQVWHVGTCLDFNEADNSYGERPCAGASAFIKELAEPTTGATGECFFDHIATVDLSDEELAVSGAFGGTARPGSVWCISDP